MAPNTWRCRVHVLFAEGTGLAYGVLASVARHHSEVHPCQVQTQMEEFLATRILNSKGFALFMGI